MAHPHDPSKNHPQMPGDTPVRQSPPRTPDGSLRTQPVRMVFLPCGCGTIHEMPDPGRPVRFRCKKADAQLEYRCHRDKGHALLDPEGAIPLHGESLRLGRDPACEIPVPEGQLSRLHCRFLFRDGAYWIEDLGSTHGTHVNESRLCAGTPVRLVGGDLIRVADRFFRYVAPAPVSPPAQPPHPHPHPPSVSTSATTPASPSVSIRGASEQVSAVTVSPLEDETRVSPEPGTIPPRADQTENATATGEAALPVHPREEPVDPLLDTDLGAFHVRSVLDQGGMGRVYRGTENATGRECVVKTMIPDRTPTPTLVDRFRREIELSARFRHPNIIEFLGMGQYGEVLYFASEFFESRDLKSWYEDTPAPFPDALGIGIQACHALEEAHAHGVIHRDIKPDNILRGIDGAVKVIDFGIAKLLDDPAYSALTMSGTAIGTPKYMAPEQMRAQRDRIGPPSDVYALAATLYFCLTSHAPRKGGSIMEIFLSIGEPPEPVSALRPDVPPQMDSILRKALAAEPEDRYPNMAAFRRALETLLPV